MAGSPPPLRLLLACGWLTEREAGDPRVRVDSAASSHAVSRVTLPDGRAVVVKHVPRAAAAAGRSLDRELFVYRLAAWMPDVAAALPRAALIDEHRQILVIESLDAGRTWPGTGPAAAVSSAAVAGRLGALMAGWHRATTALALWPSPAIGVLHLPDDVEAAAAGRASATQSLMRAIAGDAALTAGLREARAGWRDRCLIHGDIRRENWLRTSRPPGGGLRVIDWELSGSGDPAWDVGSAMAESVLDALRAGDEPSGTVTARQTAALRAFLRAYRAGRGPLDTRDRGQIEHVVLCAVARLLHVATEWTEVEGGAGSGPAQVVVARARALLARRADVTAALLRHPRRTR